MVKPKTNSFITKYSLYIVIALYFVGVAWRIVGTNNYMFPFWFDPARDAIISRQIIEEKDLKVQGPSASGTNDTVFHGVLYYYIIGPLYTLFHGDPQMVLRVVILLSGLAIFPVYGIAKSLLKPELALIAVALYTVSYDVFRATTWLSNPVIATVGIPLFFYFLWRVFFENRTREFPLLTASLALCHQSVILFAPWWLIVALCAYWQWREPENRKLWNKQIIITGFAVYLAGVSTMILAQLKVMQAGIFSLSKLSDFNAAQSSDTITIWYTFELMLGKYVQTLFPAQPVLSALVIVGIILFFAREEDKKKWFLLLMATSPLWLLSWHYRNMYHSFIGLEICAYIGFVCLLDWFWKTKWKAISIGLLLLYVVSQHSEFSREMSAKKSLYYVPQGAYLRDLLDLIDYTYSASNYQPFSISTMTNPYGYNTTWAYLYSWYGKNKYGYTPQFVGPDQTGLFGGSLLERSSKPAHLHYSIEEPNQGLPDFLFNFFDADQQKLAGTPSARLKFGTAVVDQHQVSEQLPTK